MELWNREYLIIRLANKGYVTIIWGIEEYPKESDTNELTKNSTMNL